MGDKTNRKSGKWTQFQYDDLSRMRDEWIKSISIPDEIFNAMRSNFGTNYNAIESRMSMPLKNMPIPRKSVPDRFEKLRQFFDDRLDGQYHYGTGLRLYKELVGNPILAATTQSLLTDQFMNVFKDASTNAGSSMPYRIDLHGCAQQSEKHGYDGCMLPNGLAISVIVRLHSFHTHMPDYPTLVISCSEGFAIRLPPNHPLYHLEIDSPVLLSVMIELMRIDTARRDSWYGLISASVVEKMFDTISCQQQDSWKLVAGVCALKISKFLMAAVLLDMTSPELFQQALYRHLTAHDSNINAKFIKYQQQRIEYLESRLSREGQRTTRLE